MSSASVNFSINLLGLERETAAPAGLGGWQLAEFRSQESGLLTLFLQQLPMHSLLCYVHLHQLFHQCFHCAPCLF